MIDVEPQEIAVKKGANAAQTAHTDSVQQASRNLFADASFKSVNEMFADDGMPSDGPAIATAKAFNKQLTEELVKQNLLPAVSLSYVGQGENFAKIDLNKDKSVSLDEIRKAQANAREGSIDAALYKAVGDMMESGQLPKTMTAEQISEKLKEIDANFQSQDRKNAAEAADALTNRQLFNNVAKNDGSISKEDLDAFLAKPGNTDEETLRKLRWLSANWDDRDVRELTQTGPDGRRSLTEDSLRAGANRLRQEIVLEPGKPVDYGVPASKQPPVRAWGIDDRPPSANPEDKPHEWYVSDGKGNTVAVDYDKDTGKPRYTVGTVDEAGNVHYTGWSYHKESGKYLLFDGKQFLAEATEIDFSPSTGKLTPRGLVPKAMQQGVY
ncbi:MAG TPA: hypothetical protein V6D17_03910 [Candidatus Obscuribacterales bacterium]